MYKFGGFEVARWAVFTMISAILCAMGGILVPIVARLCSSQRDVNSRVLNYGLSLSAGAMMCSSMYTMLPRAEGRAVTEFVGFLGGVGTSFLVNELVHRYTSQSLLHCAHEGGEAGRASAGRGEEGVSRSEERALVVRQSVRQYGSTTCIPLARTATVNSLAPTCGSEHKQTVVCLESNIGYDLENLATYRERYLSRLPSNTGETACAGEDEEHAAPAGHLHVMATPFSKLLSIGIQTCVAITLHKFPEGFIIFFTNGEGMEDSRLGMSVFLGLAVHNFIEGFTMTLPLYTALDAKWVAVLLTAVLSVSTQPIGALFGYFVFKHTDKHDVQLDMTLLLSITAGFLFVLALQMFQTAVAFSDTHHHHEDDDGKLIKSEHSSGTSCLKWCCLGVLLVLGSNTFAS
ncbi:AaceriAEL126Wp [[Ashbya] aceris (nom. inval.)]|nr:AaceriAEL126Wp [[Ashbya] aceris (nom. inval.)]